MSKWKTNIREGVKKNVFLEIFPKCGWVGWLIPKQGPNPSKPPQNPGVGGWVNRFGKGLPKKPFFLLPWSCRIIGKLYWKDMIFLSKSPYIFLEIMSSLKLLSKLAYFFTGMGLWHTTGARHVNIQLVFAHFFREKIFLERFYLDLKYLSLEFK